MIDYHDTAHGNGGEGVILGLFFIGMIFFLAMVGMASESKPKPCKVKYSKTWFETDKYGRKLLRKSCSTCRVYEIVPQESLNSNNKDSDSDYCGITIPAEPTKPKRRGRSRK